MRQFRPPMVRMKHLDSLLRNNRYPDCSSLARYFDVSPKCIRRDIRYMKEMLGAPIVYDSRRRGFRYEGEWQLFSGVQLSVLGIMGEYMGRMFLAVNGRPQAVVREVRKTPGEIA